MSHYDTTKQLRKLLKKNRKLSSLAKFELVKAWVDAFYRDSTDRDQLFAISLKLKWELRRFDLVLIPMIVSLLIGLLTMAVGDSLNDLGRAQGGLQDPFYQRALVATAFFILFWILIFIFTKLYDMISMYGETRQLNLQISQYHLEVVEKRQRELEESSSEPEVFLTVENNRYRLRYRLEEVVKK